MQRVVTLALAGVLLASTAVDVAAQTLRGSAQAMRRQNRIARDHDFTFLQTSAQVRRFVNAGYLVPVRGNGDYDLAAVSYPYARPALKVFIERLADQYRSACGEKLVVTSLTRPIRRQPRNASDLSVHPAGMAADLRVSNRSSCRRWLEDVLLSLEKQGVLDATREHYPPHYHVALFPTSYTRYVATLTGTSPSTVLASVTRTSGGTSSASTTDASDADAGATQVASDDAGASGAEVRAYSVKRGDSLWSIARRLGTTVDTLKELNGLTNARILAGQIIHVPAAEATEETTTR